ncbi:hypothetical protein ACOV1W_13255 [Paraclostridium bifermentans]|uniref:hypothetical protein n=1 Tax=Paraclostridium bifermentans TaxID=1490 RepID=UPI003D28425D
MNNLDGKDLSKISSEDLELNEKDKEYGPIVIRKLVTTLVKYGLLNINDMDRNEILGETLNLIEDMDFKFVLDYKDTILDNARKFRMNNEIQLSYLLYATWFEHWINEMISILAGRKDLNDKEIYEIIRNISIRGKYTWLLKLFEFEEIDEKHLKLIFKLIELRNAFVHYKWNEKNDDLKDKEAIVMENIEETVEYLIDIESKYIYNNSKEKLDYI